ncbi:MAG: GNAT family N-acetyltransferase [Halobacteriovoraceae bacterium]|nr:GNAT family N-acetyltransferase [Halobacteriovoraceae bacterium]|tara:strand:- start:12301 stop:12738 length:438 start_codon:yes stop_codon:yes gene_type:complete
MEVKQIDPKDTYPIRHAVLRQGLPIETCHFEGDSDELTFHLGAFINDKLASVASFYFKNHPNFMEQYQFQLRGMATLEEFQKQGLSAALLQTAFPIIKRNHVNLLWCNAKEAAVGFYEKMGFEKNSDTFEIEGVGPHILMHKTIQ